VLGIEGQSGALPGVAFSGDPQSSEACILICRSAASTDYVVSSELNNVSSGALRLRDDSKVIEKRVCVSFFRRRAALLGSGTQS
jgi:hypothetical protein